MTAPPDPATPARPLQTRAEVADWLCELTGALVPHLRGGLAELPFPSAQTSPAVAGLEGFARPLWGLAPLAAGGGSGLTSHDWSAFQRGLERGSDPGDPTFWGWSGDRDQRLVEMAALGFALALAPQTFWAPLSAAAQDRLARWLGQINSLGVVDNNWHWFTVLANLGLERVGRPHDPERVEAALARLSSFYQGDGWYGDGVANGGERRKDYYNPFAFHFYGLLYASLRGPSDPRSATARARATRFAGQFMHWFAPGGAAIPFGRSLTYRFAPAAFWGALAFAGVEALPWGVLKGLYLRHLRWWATQPITDRAGLLTVGYAYPNPALAEQYTSGGSPYWAFKAFLPLALPASHPFWQAAEAPLPLRPATVHQPRAGALITHDEVHSVLFPAGQEALWARHGAEKYAKFAYSSAFAFSVPAGRYGLDQGAFDSTLAVSLDGQHYIPREGDREWATGEEGLRMTWAPLPGTEVRSWVLPVPGGHLRLHRVETVHALHVVEGGWAVPFDDEDELSAGPAGAERRRAQGPDRYVALLPLLGEREARWTEPYPNTNLHFPRTRLPLLTGELPPGTHWLGCAVLAGAAPPLPEALAEYRRRLISLSLLSQETSDDPSQHPAHHE